MSKQSINPSDSLNKRVLTALNVIVAKSGHSLSWYTSKKGRIWITLKGFDPVSYTTSVEGEFKEMPDDLADTFLVLLYYHWPKFTQAQPPTDSWHALRVVADTVTDAHIWLDAMSYNLDLETGELHDKQP